MAKGKSSGRSKIQNTDKKTPRESMTKLTFGAQLIRIGPLISQKNVSSRQNNPGPPISSISIFLTPSLWPALWPTSYKRSIVNRTSENQLTVVDTGSGQAGRIHAKPHRRQCPPAACIPHSRFFQHHHQHDGSKHHHDCCLLGIQEDLQEIQVGEESYEIYHDNFIMDKIQDQI